MSFSERLANAVLSASPDTNSGASGYFSTPQATLDPHLFNQEKIKPEVRSWILNTLYDYWRKYKNAKSWSTVWIAGSGATYQWAGDRGNGDLDILIGIDWPEFFRANQIYAGLSSVEIAGVIDNDLKTDLWPQTSSQNINGQDFEVTFFVNAGGSDIRDINAYAAYNLTNNSWDVKPPTLPQDPSRLYPKTFYQAADQDKKTADVLIKRFDSLKRDLSAQKENTPGWNNTLSQLNLVTSQAKSMFDSIHIGRRAAFGEGGSGYGDYYNFRWQRNKQNGTVQALNAIATARISAREESDIDLYGNPIASADDALVRAALWRNNR